MIFRAAMLRLEMPGFAMTTLIWLTFTVLLSPGCGEDTVSDPANGDQSETDLTLDLYIDLTDADQPDELDAVPDTPTDTPDESDDSSISDDLVSDVPDDQEATDLPDDQEATDLPDDQEATDLPDDTDPPDDSDLTDDTDPEPEPYPTDFVVRFHSGVEESIWLNTTFPLSYLSVRRGEEWVRLDSWCPCSCDECPYCPMCAPPCPSVLEVPSGTFATYEWSGIETIPLTCPAEPSSSCDGRVPAPAGSYVARFCYGTEVEDAHCGQALVDQTCEEVPFELPAPDGLVEFSVDWTD